MNKFNLNSIKFGNSGKKIIYDYHTSKSISQLFSKDKFYVEYDKDISETPLSISVIPLLANILPISWFANINIYIDEIDETFYNSIKLLKVHFENYYPEICGKGDIVYKKLVNNTFHLNKSILLFSGGLDSFESLIRNYDLTPYLASIHGADIAIEDEERWSQFKKFNKKESIIINENLNYIKSNLREFYTYKVDLLLNKIGWWGEIQHGMALLGVLAPLTNLLGIKNVYIASSNTSEINFSWGSSPEVDENMKWANIKIKHDGYHLRRTDKIDNVIAFSKKNDININLRVCYSELRNGANCNICTKCQRTILGIILSGANPSHYGFQVPNNFYAQLLSNFTDNISMSEGIEYEWRCLQNKANENEAFFIIKNKKEENDYLNSFKNLDLKSLINNSLQKKTNRLKMKFILRNKFSNLYKFYLKIRY